MHSFWRTSVILVGGVVVAALGMTNVVAAAAELPQRSAASSVPTGVAEPVALKASPSGRGLYVLSRNGSVTALGDAVHRGNAALPDAAVTMAITRTGNGYWVFDAGGCVQRFGDAESFPQSICGRPLNGAVLDAATTPSGQGYWLVASDGGMFAFGDAPFVGSMGGRPLNGPVVGMAPARDGSGYWQVASDGGVFAFGVPFRGSMGGTPLNRTVIGMVASGDGYLMVGADGGIFNFGNPFFGSLGGNPPPSPIVAVAPSSAVDGRPNGYWMIDRSGTLYGFGGVWMPPAPPQPPPPPVVFAGDGTFRVGIDIVPGTYRTAAATSGCYWARRRGTTGASGEIIANDIGSGFRVVTILASDVAFETSRCGSWTTSVAPFAAPQGPIAGDGVYRVGVDIAAGTWQSSSPQSCYWARIRAFTGRDDIIANDIGSGLRTVTIAPGDLGFLSSRCGTWSKVG